MAHNQEDKERQLFEKVASADSSMRLCSIELTPVHISFWLKGTLVSGETTSGSRGVKGLMRSRKRTKHDSASGHIWKQSLVGAQEFPDSQVLMMGSVPQCGLGYAQTADKDANYEGEQTKVMNGTLLRKGMIERLQ